MIFDEDKVGNREPSDENMASSTDNILRRHRTTSTHSTSQKILVEVQVLEAKDFAKSYRNA